MEFARQNSYPIWPLYLLIAVFPFAVAGQNFGVAISFLALFYFLISETEKQVATNTCEDNFSSTPKSLKILMGLTGLYVLWMCVATQIADLVPGSKIASYFVGFLPFIVIPMMCRSVYEELTFETIKKIWKLVVILTSILAVVSLTQYFFEWHKHVGYYSANSHRSQGFYSHPLTFAYVMLMIWPMAVLRVIGSPKSRSSWVFFLSCIICLWTSESRTVQLVSLGILFFNVMNYLPKKHRFIVVFLMIASIIGISITDNPLSRKYADTFTKRNTQRSENVYPIDRMAFWHAHYNLWKSSPLVGHGTHIPSEVRNKAYDDIGLESFQKKYTAHNMFLQILVEGGVIGLILFCSWMFGYIYIALKHSRKSIIAAALGQSLFGLCVAGMTQNAFQDSEVRHVVMVMIIIFWCSFGRIMKEKRSGNATTKMV